MKLICIMPARGGSTRIPGKNIIDFHGKPIMAWPLEVLVKSPSVDEVFVSSDSEEILKVAGQLGAQTISRPADLSDNFVGIVPVVQNAINSLPETISDEDLVLCVFPTNVFLSHDRIVQALELFKKNPSQFVLGVVAYPQPIERALVGSLETLKMNRMEDALSRTQDLPKSFFDAGYFYLSTAENWIKTDSVFSGKVTGLSLSNFETVDIDDPEDLRFASMLFQIQVLQNPD